MECVWVFFPEDMILGHSKIFSKKVWGLFIAGLTDLHLEYPKIYTQVIYASSHGRYQRHLMVDPKISKF